MRTVVKGMIAAMILIWLFSLGEREPKPPDRLGHEMTATSILIAPGDPQAFTGTHQLRTATAPDGALVGCVPCLNIFTSVAIFDGEAFGLIGYTIGHRNRYRVMHRGAVMPVRSILDSRRSPAHLIDAVRAIEGCRLPPGDIFEHLHQAMVRGVCLAR